MRRMAGNLLALMLALGVSLGAGEVLLRAFVTLPLPRTEPEVRYRPHPVRRFTLAPGQRAFSYGAPAEIDARGFRANGAGGAGERAGPTIFALGDSFTFGLGVRDEETWPSRLEAGLRERLGGAVSVVNGGTISYGVFQEMDLLREAGMATGPALVVHGLYWNDFMNAEPPPPEAPSVLTSDGHFVWDQPTVPRSWMMRGLSWVSSRSALAFALKGASAGLRRSEESTYQQAYAAMLENGLSEADWGPIERFYRDLQTLGGEAGFSVFVVIMPVSDIALGAEAARHTYPAEARRRLDALGLPYLDGFSLGIDRTVHFLPQGADAHLNAEGYGIVADALAEKLKGAPELHLAGRGSPGVSLAR